MSVSILDVERAAERIAGYARRTPVLEMSPGVFLKLEALQHSGSFKVRAGSTARWRPGRPGRCPGPV
nr:hypothetical protein GCM10020093_111010 [Planobispora longispora]